MPDQPTRQDPFRPMDDEARATLARLLSLGHAALAFTDPATGTPGISRIAFARDPEVGPLTLISSLTQHHGALLAHPDCAVMLGEPGAKGDPLTHPRLMIRARACFVAADDPARPALRARWLERAPKAGLYIDLADFAFVRLSPVSALLNGGFGRAYRIDLADL